MKQFCIFVSVFLFVGGVFTVSAQDMIVLRDGNIIQAKVMEINPSEIKYKRFDNLNGPMVIISKDRVLSIKYENGVLDIMNASPAGGQERGQPGGTGSYDSQYLGAPTPLQTILNALPAIRIAGTTLKFQFGGDKWLATVNGENFSTGSIGIEDTDNGSILTLKQTHIWPGAVGRTAGRAASMIPGAGAVGGALNTAGTIAGVAGPIEAPGREIVLEYKAGPPAKLSFVRSVKGEGDLSDTEMAGGHPLEAENRFDLDGFNAFAVSIGGIPPFWLLFSSGSGSAGAGLTFTIFEKYKPNAFFIPSYFLSGKYIYFFNEGVSGTFFDISPGVLFRHRFPGNRVLWNLGASLDFIWVGVYTSYISYSDNGGSSASDGSYHSDYYNEDRGPSFLLGIGAQTGFSFRFNPYTSLDINGLIKIPFGTVEMRRENYYPFTGGVELTITYWFPYRSRE